MSPELIILVPIVVLPIVLLFSFAGCTTFGSADAPEKPISKPGPPLVVEPPPPPPPPPVQHPEKYHDVVTGSTFEAICYWKLDEKADAPQAIDSIAPADNGNYLPTPPIHGVVDGVLRLGPDNQDVAASFNGTTNYVQIPHKDLINPPLSFSIEAWIRPDGALTTRQVIAGSYRLNAANVLERGWVLEILPGPTVRARVRIAYQPNQAVATTAEAAAVANLVDPGNALQGWHHLVGVYNAATKSLLLYVNTQPGLQAGQTTPLPGANPRFTPNATTSGGVVTNLRIGAGFPEPFNALAAAFHFAGRIDQVALYRQALTGSEVRKHIVAATTA